MAKYIKIIAGIAVIGFFYLLFLAANGSSFETIGNFEGGMTIYKSLTCGCCGIYGNYFKSKGNSDVEIINIDIDNADAIRDQYGVPVQLRTCHTTIIGDYFVEGHIPLEAIEKLLLEQPDIAGIAMPGMPSGSPGMPGAKLGDFIIYSVNKDQTYEEFMRI